MKLTVLQHKSDPLNISDTLGRQSENLRMPESSPIQLSVRTLARDISQKKGGTEGHRSQRENRIWNQNILQRLIRSPETALVEVKLISSGSYRKSHSFIISFAQRTFKITSISGV